MVDITKDFPKVAQALGARAEDFLSDNGVRGYIAAHKDLGVTQEVIDGNLARLYSVGACEAPEPEPAA